MSGVQLFTVRAATTADLDNSTLTRPNVRVGGVFFKHVPAGDVGVQRDVHADDDESATPVDVL